jgi:hypothetical protein
MTIHSYIPINYFTYNRPDYLGAVLICILFTIFYIMLFLALKFEHYNRLDYCDPMFYYGRPCNNEYSKILLFNDKFLEFKKKYYDLVAKYDKKEREVKGVRENTEENKKSIETDDEVIKQNIDDNQQFTSSTLDEIQKIIKVSNLITTKYLGNIQSLLSNIQNVPSYILENLQSLSLELGNLKNAIQQTMVTPAFKKYTAPLEKLYRSLTILDETTLPYTSSTNENS